MSRQLIVLGALIGFALPASARAEKSFDKVFPLPMGGGVVPLNAKVGEVSLVQINVRNPPNKGDFEKAKKDPTESSRPKFQVRLTNAGKDKAKLKLEVRLEAADGSPLLSCDTKEKLDPGTKNFESNLCWLQSIRVADWPKAKLRLKVTVD